MKLQTTLKITDLNFFRIQDKAMDCSYSLPCPNCGAPALRRYLHNSSLRETTCETCDYLMVSCEETGNVVESYAPGLYSF
ncbi:hypothetical protein SAMN06272755_1551 [Picosynechococcus sp. OG1]|nr:hypothetical protein [Picosynechococcus sp. PCC 7002]ACA98277.1 conserved hypothetical protein [Picosynechococcus sp. PCC 7002]SMH45279.1 hypothetical protein SAMN06272755_1551 [Picosynechococcus sp. OG1]SMQ80166.1 hypothetical protein SAMN06272774_0831 [Synechococcus sp. 7002]